MTSHEAPNMTPAQIDAVLAPLWAKVQITESYIYRMGQYPARNDADAARRGEQVATYRATINAAKAEARPYEQEFLARGGWNRYFLVTNAGGHIHRGMHCTTCYDTTQYSWLIELADCDEAAMVAQYGELACTVCFPDAPTYKGFGDGTSAVARYTAAEKAQRAADKAAKAAAKNAKAIYAPDGSPLRDDYRSVIKTERAASIACTDALVYAEYANDRGTRADLVAEYRATARRMAEAIAAKHGTDTDEVLAAHQAKADKKIKAEKRAAAKAFGR